MSVTPLGAGTPHRPVRFTKIVAQLDGKKYYYETGGLLCIRGRTLEWSGPLNDNDAITYTEAIFEEFAKANVALRGDPAKLFDTSDVAEGELQLAAVITDLRLDICNRPETFGGDWGDAGQAYIELQWKLYDPVRGTVIVERTTRGSGSQGKPIAKGRDVVTKRAIAGATRNLLGDSAFVSSLTNPTGPQAAK